MPKFVFLLLIILTACSPAQQKQATSSLSLIDSLKQCQLQNILLCDSFVSLIENTYETHQRSEPLGYIDSNYQRLYIHFNTIQKNPKNPLEYLCSGATRVHNTICHFKGALTLKNAFATPNKFQDQHHHCATIVFDVRLYEDSTEYESGFFTGQLEYDVWLDSSFTAYYDGLEFYADSYANNRFTGQWHKYKSTEIKPCGWGDYRIPNSDDLDVGAGEFSVNEPYVKNGWQDYMDSWGTHGDSLRTQKARERESYQWWK